MAMIFGDYVGGFLGLSRDGIGCSMNPFDVSSPLLYDHVLGWVLIVGCAGVADQDG